MAGAPVVTGHDFCCPGGNSFTTMICGDVWATLLTSFFLLSESSCAVHAICRYKASQDLLLLEIVTETARGLDHHQRHRRMKGLLACRLQKRRP